jgi:hypothetical protein
VVVVGTVRRGVPGVVESRELPAPLSIPFLRLVPAAAAPVDMAFRFGRRGFVRPAWAPDSPIVLPVETMRPPGRPPPGASAFALPMAGASP